MEDTSTFLHSAVKADSMLGKSTRVLMSELIYRAKRGESFETEVLVRLHLSDLSLADVVESILADPHLELDYQGFITFWIGDLQALHDPEVVDYVVHVMLRDAARESKDLKERLERSKAKHISSDMLPISEDREPLRL